jgi:hypothetical protein
MKPSVIRIEGVEEQAAEAYSPQGARGHAKEPGTTKKMFSSACLRVLGATLSGRRFSFG